MNTITLYDINGKEVEKIELKKEIFDGQINTALLHQAMLMYDANLRQGNACVKDRSQVSGGGIKPWKQKGTGRARVGSIRSPLWRHGGVTFGPQLRDYSFSMPQKMRALALKSSINSKLNSQDLILIEDISLNEPKTKELKKILESLKVKGKVLLVTPLKGNNLFTACRNIPSCKVKTGQQISASDVLRAQKIIITRTAFKELTARLKNR